jgi:hypothetical protein
LKAENVFKIATTYSRVREFLASKGWEFQGKDEEMGDGFVQTQEDWEEGVRRGHFG